MIQKILIEKNFVEKKSKKSVEKIDEIINLLIAPLGAYCVGGSRNRCSSVRPSVCVSVCLSVCHEISIGTTFCVHSATNAELWGSQNRYIFTRRKDQHDLA